MEARVGDRVSIDAKKVGQPRRTGVVEDVSEGISGLRYTVRWDDGHSTTLNPQAGVLTVERRRNSRGSRPTSKAKSKGKSKGKAAGRSSKRRGR